MFIDPNILILEIGTRTAVGACGSLMAQIGANVVVVETPNDEKKGKWSNRSMSVAGKKSITINSKSKGDMLLLDDLIVKSDVIILSSDYDTTFKTHFNSKRPDKQIICNITAFGQVGPLANRGSEEAIIQALSGIAETTGPHDDNPIISNLPFLEISSSIFAASAILAGLIYRKNKGKGQRIEVSIFDTAINQLINFLPLEFAGQKVTRSGNRHPLHYPWGSYKTINGYILMCSVTTEQFKKIAKAIGSDDLMDDDRFSTSAARRNHYLVFEERLIAWTSSRTVEECEKIMSALSIPCGKVISINDLRDDCNLIHRKSISKAYDEQLKKEVEIPSSPIHGHPFSGVTPRNIVQKNKNKAEIINLLKYISSPLANEFCLSDEVYKDRPLDGITVVEIGQYTVAPLVSKCLGSMGADVIKIEPPIGDAIRRSAPLREDGESYIFALSNTDKKGLVLDIKTEKDLNKLKKLLTHTDILVENLKPGTLAKLGLNSQTLAKEFPHLIYCSINGFGNDSAYPGRPALDTVIQAMSGIMSLTTKNEVPYKTGSSISDMVGGEIGLFSVLAGLMLRDTQSIATHFDISMQDASMWLTQMQWSNDEVTKDESKVFKTKDGHVVAIINSVNRHKIQDLISLDYDKKTLINILTGFNIECSDVLTISEVLESEHLKACSLLVNKPTEDQSNWIVVASPMKLLSTPTTIKSVMSRLGSQDKEIIQKYKLTH